MIRWLGEPAVLALLLTVGLALVMTLANPALVIAASAAWAAWDSAGVKLTRYQSFISHGPFALFVVTFLVWPIAFPWYVVIRQRIRRGTFRQRARSDAPGAAIAFFLACSLLLAGLVWFTAGRGRGSHSDDGAGMAFFMALSGWLASGAIVLAWLTKKARARGRAGVSLDG